MMKLGIYKHYKGGDYEVIGLANHSETLEKMVIYVPLYELEPQFEKYWVRPLSMFEEEVLSEGKLVKRFIFVADKK